MNQKIRILVADDHPVVRDGLVAILSTQADFEIVGEANDGSEAVSKAREYEPNVILIDLEMPEVDGVQAIQQIRATHPRIQFIVFTAFDTDERILKAVQAGAKGYLLKGAPRNDVFRAIRTVYAGGSLLEPIIASKLLNQIQENPDDSSGEPSEKLTDREMEVLQFLGKGMKNKEIADQLFITERTVKFYVSAILSKLNASNRTEAVSLAAQRGLIQL